MPPKKKQPKEFLDALIYDKSLRQRLEKNPEATLKAELAISQVGALPAALFPKKGFKLPPPHRIKRIVDCLEKNGFFPCHDSHDLYAVMCVVQPAFPLVA